MIKVITHSDSFVIKCDDIHKFVDNMISNCGFYYYNDHVFIPFHDVVKVETIKPKENNG